MRLRCRAVFSVARVLQSLVAATLINIGNNYLSHLYRVVDEGTTSALVGTRASYFEETHLDPPSLEELEWWQGNLRPQMGKKEVPLDSEVLGVRWEMAVALAQEGLWR